MVDPSRLRLPFAEVCRDKAGAAGEVWDLESVGGGGKRASLVGMLWTSLRIRRTSKREGVVCGLLGHLVGGGARKYPYLFKESRGASS